MPGERAEYIGSLTFRVSVLGKSGVIIATRRFIRSNREESKELSLTSAFAPTRPPPGGSVELECGEDR